jgi:hypothetical protein
MESEILDFNLILEQDLENIIKKSAAGAPLNARERELIQAERVKREKQAAPVAKAPKAKSGRASKTGFESDYNTYATRYDASRRTVMRWVATGKAQKPDPIPCPLDAPGEMRDWWQKCQSQKCPDGILAAEVAWIKETGGSVKAPRSESAAEEFSLPSDLDSVEVGLSAALGRLQVMELEFSKKATEPGQAKNWFDSISRMTSVATNVRKELEAQGKLAPKKEVEIVLRDYLSPIERGIRGMYRSFCVTLGQQSNPLMAEEWGKKCDELFKNWGKELFADV